MFLHLDEPTRPLVVHVEVRLAGAIDEDRLRGAISQAAGRHPLARARLQPWSSDAKTYEWVVDDAPHVDPLRVLDVSDMEIARRRPRRLLQPRDPAVRVTSVPRAGCAPARR